jgi:hypothetical protein
MLSGAGLAGMDGSAWYHPLRLTIDAGAVADENANPAQAILARQSGIPDSRLTLVNRRSTYAHNDPSAASPSNEFLDNLIPFLATIDHKGPSLHQAA